MGVTGKYDFKGIQKAGAAGIKALLALTTWGAFFVAAPIYKVFEPVFSRGLELLLNYMANNGLIIINIGANWANGEIDQASFDKSLDEGLRRVGLGRDKLTPAQGKAIDDAVIKAADEFIDFGAAPDGVPVDADPGFQGRGDTPV